MQLLFDQRKLPRSMTRQEWREIDRWRRVTRKTLQEAVDRESEALSRALTNLGAFGTTGYLVERAERLVNPPVLIGPYQE